VNFSSETVVGFRLKLSKASSFAPGHGSAGIQVWSVSWPLFQVVNHLWTIACSGKATCKQLHMQDVDGDRIHFAVLQHFLTVPNTKYSCTFVGGNATKTLKYMIRGGLPMLIMLLA